MSLSKLGIIFSNNLYQGRDLGFDFRTFSTFCLKCDFMVYVITKVLHCTEKQNTTTLTDVQGGCVTAFTEQRVFNMNYLLTHYQLSCIVHCEPSLLE